MFSDETIGHLFPEPVAELPLQLIASMLSAQDEALSALGSRVAGTALETKFDATLLGEKVVEQAQKSA
ncbi:hypothetical protein [Adhaeretor mobilis]|uniref:Uncharacterized protein n=1 Tax=Adhaeretor mobilis TaxID=1930276 RepID=A0A517MZY4_9BACT|nr:hypothetical protein [Adhaeretor mobilis]QDT00358.1 hypothetical protein HG15A2_36940 [Adhaeretor mobilis]